MGTERTIYLWVKGVLHRTSFEFHENILCTPYAGEMEFLADNEGWDLFIDGETCHVFYEVMCTGLSTYEEKIGYCVPIRYTEHDIVDKEQVCVT